MCMQTQAMAEQAAQLLPPLPAEAEVVLTAENKTPISDAFQFQRVADGLVRAGAYRLEYAVLPQLPGGAQLRAAVGIIVVPGPAASCELQGEGRGLAQSKAMVLGEALPPLRLALHDAYGNLLTSSSSSSGGGGSPASTAVAAHDAAGAGVPVEETVVPSSQEQPLPQQQSQRLPQLQFEVLTSSLEAGGTVVEDVRVLADVVSAGWPQSCCCKVSGCPCCV